MAPTQDVLRLDESDISKAFIDKFCGDEELEWENHLIHSQNEGTGGVSKVKEDQTSSVDGSDELTSTT